MPHPNIKENEINTFSPRLVKTGPVVILRCLVPDNFTHQVRTSTVGGTGLRCPYLPISLP